MIPRHADKTLFCRPDRVHFARPGVIPILSISFFFGRAAGIMFCKQAKSSDLKIKIPGFWLLRARKVRNPKSRACRGDQA